MKKIVLASSSPRRSMLLEYIGIPFVADPSSYNEKGVKTKNPHKLTKTHAVKKAQEVAVRYRNAVIIGADTIVYLGGEILEKPQSKTHARKMLQKLSGRKHEVITGICLLDTDTGEQIVSSVLSTIYFKRLLQKEIDWYIKTNEPMDKAGAYAVQGKGGLFIEKIEGDYYNIVGLPIATVYHGLGKLGISLT